MTRSDTVHASGTMRAVLLAGTADQPSAEIEMTARPGEQPGRLIVEVVAAGITKMEPHWITGWQYPDGTRRSGPIVLGCEFAGFIRSPQAGEHGFADGQAVLGMTGQYHKGAMAEFVSARAEDLIPLSGGLSFEEASTLPLAGLTAWQALVRYGSLQNGQRLLIHGGAGGVGAFAIQIARWIGAHVVVTAAGSDAALCRGLGADAVIDFQRERFEEHGRDYDLVFDQIGGDVQERSWSVLKKGGSLVTIAGEETDAPDPARARALGVTARFFIVDRNAGELLRLTELVTMGAVRPVISKRFTFETVAEAFDDRSGHFPGKAVLVCSRAGEPSLAPA